MGNPFYDRLIPLYNTHTRKESVMKSFFSLPMAVALLMASTLGCKPQENTIPDPKRGLSRRHL